jgi:hypothetical protein
LQLMIEYYSIHVSPYMGTIRKYEKDTWSYSHLPIFFYSADTPWSGPPCPTPQTSGAPAPQTSGTPAPQTSGAPAPTLPAIRPSRRRFPRLRRAPPRATACRARWPAPGFIAAPPPGEHPPSRLEGSSAVAWGSPRRRLEALRAAAWMAWVLPNKGPGAGA